MAIVNWEPVKELMTLRNRLDRPFEEARPMAIKPRKPVRAFFRHEGLL